MGLKHLADIDLPPGTGPGGFDHAAVHRARGLLYVAHTANDAIDVIDTRAGRYLRSIGGLKGVAGALVHEPQDLVFTSNRGEDTVGMFGPEAESDLVRVGVGVRPNGLAFDPARHILLSANVGDPGTPGSHTVTLVDVRKRAILASVPVPGRTRWTVFDPTQGVFFVNIADPAEIVVIDPRQPQAPAGRFRVPDRGPHGLDIDLTRHCLYCACDGGKLVSLDSASGSVHDVLELSGAPDVIFLDRELEHLHVAIGDPGVIDVIDTAQWRRLETIQTEHGAHTLALDVDVHRIYAFLPASHRASVFEDRG
jgi:DNA-binding beta-propeller fold protein YncE